MSYLAVDTARFGLLSVADAYYTATAVVALTAAYLFYARWTFVDQVQIAIHHARAPNEATRKTYEALATVLPAVIFTRKDRELFDSLKSLFAAQAHYIIPAYLVRPENANQVSIVVKILSEAIKSSDAGDVRFGIRSGGHNTVAGSAGVEAGILIDLSLLNSVIVAEDSKTVDVGPGARWKDVYRTLDAHGLSCAGGRACDVGVGGLILGGGLSFFSPQIGFVCDQVVSFEAVLADGSIVQANADSHPDLTIALRGGGNNFAVVTKYTLHTFHQAKLWTGHVFHWPSAIPSLLAGYYEHTRPETYDPCATVLFGIGYFGRLNMYLPAPSIHYTKPVANPPALQWVTKAPHFYSTLKIRTMSEATDTINATSAFTDWRWMFTTTTFENNLEMTHRAYAAYQAACTKVRRVPGIVFAISLQPLVPSATKYHTSNAMGIDTDKTLTILLFVVYWKRATDDDLINAAASDAIKVVEAEAKGLGVFHPYKYANYASKGQEVYEGYGEGKLQMLQAVASKYDPHGVFSKRSLPGGFKLS